jgi:hypothetical protein
VRRLRRGAGEFVVVSICFGSRQNDGNADGELDNSNSGASPRSGGARRGTGQRRQPRQGVREARAPPFIGAGAAAPGVSGTHAEGRRRLGQAGLGCRARMGSGGPDGWAELERVGPSGSAQ